ncbi:MAG TPA: dipeptidase, partial [Thermodesulfobacteriota bacterium]|nr:dipeptidase [Thermodesulfobacteriota bacterium]
MADWENYLVQNKDALLRDLLEFLSIPSVSALPAHRADIARAAQWLEKRMKAAGIESVRIIPTGGASPIVYGEWRKAPGKPTILIYGHYDVQPVDPLNLWDSPPFEPAVKNGRIYARGATDDKGNLFIPLIVVESMLKTAGTLPVNLKFLFEGEEEVGSPHLPDFLSANKDLFSCDLVLSADGGQWEEDQPALILGTRGLASVFVDLEGPGHDLHSGTFGGTIMNPLHALARIVDSLHDSEGRVTVDGFYDDVRPLTGEERAEIGRIPFDERKYLHEIGAPALFGEPGFNTYERAWARPTLEINGLWGGFQGEGLKTVLPSKASAKISCRIVADQDPAKITDLVIRHIRKVTPPGVTVSLSKRESGSFPY